MRIGAHKNAAGGSNNTISGALSVLPNKAIQDHVPSVRDLCINRAVPL